MSASQYYKVTALVGVPHRNAVEVTVPLVGPQGPTGPAGSGLETLTTLGDTLYRGASTGERLPIGTTGQILKVSAGGIPEWGAAPSSGVTSVTGTAPIVSSGGTTPAISISAATTSAAGSMSSADKAKLDGVAASATANSSDATLLNRANHTGTQSHTTITGLGTAATANLDAIPETLRIVGGTDATKKLAFEVDTLVDTATTRTLTVPNASGTIALLETLPAGGTKTYATFTAEHNQPPATAFATLDTRNSIAVLDFDDATDESAVFVSIIPEAASLGSGLKIRLHWMATTATSGNVVWDVSLERMTTDLDSDSFDTIASGTAAANGTSGILTVTEITLTTIDSVTAGDGYRLKVTRDANNASDTMTGDAELVVCEVRSAA